MKILFLCVHVPYSFAKASEYRNHQIIEALKQNYDVRVAVMKPDYLQEYKEKYNTDIIYIESKPETFSEFERVFYGDRKLMLSGFTKPKKATAIEDAINEFGAGMVIYSSVGFYPYIKNLNVKKVFNVNKVLYMYYQRLATQHKFLKKKMLKKMGLNVGKWEREAFVASDMILFTSLNDMANVNSNMQLLTPSYYLPAYADVIDYLPLCDKHHIMIVGNYQSKAGKMMYDYFINTIHPDLIKKYSDYKLYVVGSHGKDMYKDDYIEFSPRPTEAILHDVRVLLLPYKVRMDMQYAAIKAMSHGIPMIGYEKCMDFFAVKKKDDYCIGASSQQDLKNKFFKYMDNDAYLEKIRLKAFDYVKDHYSKDLFEKTMKDCMEKLLSR